MTEQHTETVHSEREAFRVLQRERDELLISVRELSHAQLIARDIEVGLRSELMQARIDLENAEGRTIHTVGLIRKSTTWKIGRIVTKPVGLVRRLLGRK
ncbi:hypothetical protein [Luethyella okanaganae]|uniref:Uncharacterized protein n=1 Tax=Luethyella okanaganae TaxID=69372 RepID=A0ABW1VA42_9MICO